jgi:CheY-like chemotaxis protein
MSGFSNLAPTISVARTHLRGLFTLLKAGLHWPAAGAMWLALLASSGVPLRAQDPFGESPAGDNPFGSAVPAAGADAASPFGGFGVPPAQPDKTATAGPSDTSRPSEKDNDPIIRLLRENPPQTPAEMAEGLMWVVRMKRWDEVHRLLDLIATKQWALPQLVELADAGGESLWFRLSVDEAALSEDQHKLLDSIVAAKGTLARDPAWLDSWIAKLSHPQPGERRLAQLRLQAGGAAAITRLLERLQSSDASTDATLDAGMLAGTIAEFGQDGSDALRAACLVTDPQRAGRAYLGIAEIPGQEFSIEIAAGLASSVLTPEYRQALEESVSRRFSKVPTPVAIEQFLSERFARKLDEYQQSREVPAAAVEELIWRPAADGKSVAAFKGSREERQLEGLARVAAHRMNLTRATTDDLVDCAAVVLQRAYRVQPVLQPSEKSQEYLAKFDQLVAADASYWIRVFDRASELQMHGGALGAIQQLSRTAAGHYLIPLDFLTRLLGDSRPMVRYLALQQIAAIDPKQAFGGAEKALEVALEMARLGSGPQALVIGRSADLRQAAQQQLEQQVGARVTTADSARSALLALDGGQPIEMVLVVDRVSDQSIFELLQRLRTAERSRALPIAVMTDELYQHERRLIGELPGVVASQLSRSPQHMHSVIAKLMERLDTEPFSTEQRNHFAEAAGEFLARIAKDRDQYAFYPLSDWRSELESIGRGLPIASRLALLSALGSPTSQIQLVTLASSSSLSAAERMEAAQGFTASVHRFGMNLGREEVQHIYDVYNALGPNDPATAKSLGAVLDAIEARVR